MTGAGAPVAHPQDHPAATSLGRGAHGNVGDQPQES
jgi:hypothetical protein